jgi:hypothetical protein
LVDFSSFIATHQNKEGERAIARSPSFIPIGLQIESYGSS